MKEINLIESYLKKPKIGAEIKRQTRVIVLVFLLAYCLVTAAVFSYWFVLKNKSESLVKKSQAQEVKIKEYQKVESLHVLVKQRLAALVPLFDKEPVDTTRVLNRLEELLPPGVTVKDIGFDGLDEFKISGEAESVVAFVDFLNRLQNLEKDDYFKGVELTSAVRAENRRYSFDVVLNVQS